MRTERRWTLGAVGLAATCTALSLLVGCSATTVGDDQPPATRAAVPDDSGTARAPGSSDDPGGSEQPEELAGRGELESLDLESLGRAVSVPASRRLLGSGDTLRSGSSTSELVAGFPAALRPPGTAQISSSSVSAARSRVQFALVARTAASPARVLRTYRQRLARRGFVEHAAAGRAGTQTASFTDDGDSVAVAVDRDGDRTVVSLHAVLTPTG